MKSQQQISTVPVAPTLDDILCGRGKTCFEHEGNRRFRLVLLEHIPKYIEAPTRKLKTVVVRAILQQLMGVGARFLKRSSKGYWYDSGLRGAKQKVGHSLRDASTDRIKSISKMQQQKARASYQRSRAPKILGRMPTTVEIPSSQFCSADLFIGDISNNTDPFDSWVSLIDPVEEEECVLSLHDPLISEPHYVPDFPAESRQETESWAEISSLLAHDYGIDSNPEQQWANHPHEVSDEEDSNCLDETELDLSLFDDESFCNTSSKNCLLR